MRDLLGKLEVVERDLKHFQASSVFWVRRDLWRADSRVVI